MKPDGFIVMYNDLGGLGFPLGWDEDFVGALCYGTGVALFDSRVEARKAVTVSRRLALLKQAQGLPFNDDFVSGIKNIQIQPLTRKFL